MSKDVLHLAIRRFAKGDPNGSPREVIMSIEDWIDYPPHTIDGRTADKILEALNRAGYKIERG